jgi:hypothetical protein
MKPIPYTREHVAALRVHHKSPAAHLEAAADALEEVAALHEATGDPHNGTWAKDFRAVAAQRRARAQLVRENPELLLPWHMRAQRLAVKLVTP